MIEEFIVDALAVYRVTRMVTRDTVLSPWRDPIIRRAYRVKGYSEHGLTDWTEYARKDPRPPKLAEWITCPFCVSVWVAAAAIGTRGRAPRLRRLLALAGASVVVHRFVDA